MLIGHEHLPVGHVGKAVEVEEGQQPFGWVLLKLEPLLLVQGLCFVEDVNVDPAFSQVMEESAQPQLVELELGQAKPVADDDAEDADIHTMGERVLVVVPQRGHGNHGGLIR